MSFLSKCELLTIKNSRLFHYENNGTPLCINCPPVSIYCLLLCAFVKSTRILLPTSLDFNFPLLFAGQLEIGFSAQLPKDVRVEGSKQADLHGWTWTQKPGFFQYGTDVTSNDIIEAPLTGVYFISANLLIKSMHKNLLKACFGEAACNTYDHPLKSISLVFLVRFQKGDKLSLNILSQKTIIVESGSSFSFQFLGTQSSAPGFSFVLDKNNRVDGLTQDIVHISKEWKAQDNEDTTLFNSLEGNVNPWLLLMRISCSNHVSYIH